jgi:hypothetical protein
VSHQQLCPIDAVALVVENKAAGHAGVFRYVCPNGHYATKWVPKTGSDTTHTDSVPPLNENTAVFGRLMPEVYDRVDLTYNDDGEVATATYWSAGAVVRSLALSYEGGHLVSVATL